MKSYDEHNVTKACVSQPATTFTQQINVKFHRRCNSRATATTQEMYPFKRSTSFEHSTNA